MTTPSAKSSLAADLKLTIVILLCGAVNAINIAKLAPSIPAIQTQFGLSLSAIGLLASLFSMLVVMSGVLIGGSVKAVGAKNILVLALLVACFGNLVSVVGNSQATLFAGRVIEGISLISIILTGPSLLAQHTSPDRRGMVMGLWGSFMPLGNVAALLAAPSLLAIGSWQALWLAGLIFSGLVTLLAIRTIPADRAEGKRHFNLSGIRHAVHTPVLAIVGVGFAAHSLVYQVLLQFIPLFTHATAGLSATLATTVAALFCVCNFAGNILSGQLIQSGIRPTMFARLVGILVAMLLLLLSIVGTQSWIIISLLAVTGLVSGGTAPVFFYIVSQQQTEPANMPVFVAWMFQIQGFGMLIGPALIGRIVDYGQSWTWGLLSLIPVCLLISISSFFLQPVRSGRGVSEKR